MESGNTFFVTFDAAVARMINFDYIPEGFSLLDMTDAFREDAEVAYENGRLEVMSAEDIDKLRDRLDTCDARHTLAMALMKRLEKESKNSDSELGFDLTSDHSPLVSLPSLSTWAADNFGIVLRRHERSTAQADSHEESAPQRREWEDITLKIYANCRVGWTHGDARFINLSFQDINLFDKRTLGPNNQGAILIGLSMGKKFPGGTIQGKDKAAISRLRDSLQKLTAIPSDPFCKYNPTDGWRPRFKLIDDQRNADERAKTQAQHVPYDDSRNYQAEGDDAGKWLEQNE